MNSDYKIKRWSEKDRELARTHKLVVVGRYLQWRPKESVYAENTSNDNQRAAKNEAPDQVSAKAVPSST